MSEGLSTRARAALDAMRDGRVEKVDGWYRIGMMENVGLKTLLELQAVPELELLDFSFGSGNGPHWRRVRARFREQASAQPAPAGDDRVVVLLAEILGVLRDRL